MCIPMCSIARFGGHEARKIGGQKVKDAAFLLTVGSFLLTVELFYFLRGGTHTARQGGP